MTDGQDVSRVARLLWRERADSGGTRRRLDADTIVETAIALADTGGLAAVSMQRIAETLECTAMGLYRHVPGKAELVAAMTDAAYGPPPKPPGTSGWRAEVEAWVDALWRVYLAHPWVVRVPTRGAPIGPNELDWFEALARPLTAVDAPGLNVVHVATFLSSAVRDLARVQLEIDTDQSEYDRVLARHLEPGRFPTLTRLFVHDEPDDDTVVNPALHDGMRLLLDSIERAETGRKEPRTHE